MIQSEKRSLGPQPLWPGSRLRKPLSHRPVISNLKGKTSQRVEPRAETDLEVKENTGGLSLRSEKNPTKK